MKPQQARAMRLRQDAERAARGDALESYLQSGQPTTTVQPDLIPDGTALTVARREVRSLVRRAERTPRDRRGDVLDDLLFALARLVFVERVMAKDRLERAALTPARLAVMSRVSPDDLRRRLSELQGEPRVAVPS